MRHCRDLYHFSHVKHIKKKDNNVTHQATPTQYQKTLQATPTCSDYINVPEKESNKSEKKTNFLSKFSSHNPLLYYMVKRKFKFLPLNCLYLLRI